MDIESQDFSMLSVDELNRYSRHILLDNVGVNGQLTIRKSRVLVVGSGGLGCPVLQYLTAAGVGHIGIVDFDLVDISNLHRQILFGIDDINKPKAEVAAQKLSKLNQNVNIKVHNYRLTKNNALEVLSDYEIIVDCTDNFPTKFLINDACVILNKPFVYGALYKFEGQVGVFNYRNGATYRCFIPEQPEEIGGLSCSEVGVLSIVPGIIGCYQANEVLKIILDIGTSLSGRLLLIDCLTSEFNIINIEKDNKYTKIKELGIYHDIKCDNNNDINQITINELKIWINQKKDFLIIDIRNNKEFIHFHIEKSVNISIEKLLNEEYKLPEDKPVVLVCNYGSKSNQVAQQLKDKYHYSNLMNLNGGLIEWINHFDDEKINL
ncbi:MAG: HesA/MoeB/ThiF family protein [Bacteroidetes bacterium]|jgi:adenylyltransferase/sulfurtransferase|nr:HesA/MoeB/ThiF family protein [Bacteroidota bacterium]MBU1578530.1 HesA/MoeB/ThiF family protein [Bacteroidota bacterium]MBU2465754.1 HesA/MoeB/ThiF family protein [Bacteroidota bacterium]MBU2556147.1 HesA/MoeB/ThiF family protein [Bacteroidota bacterium]MDX9803558.1 HesA/MoeB/ThiF family protein [Dehalococcoidales bacterium]